jgi:hypothetical protein
MVRTAVVLGILLVLDVGLLRGLGGGIVSLVVAAVGFVLLVPGALFALFHGQVACARSRALRACLYLLLGVSALVAMRSRTQPFADFRESLKPGMSVGDVVRRLDQVYARNPGSCPYVAAWGTTHEFRLEDAQTAAQAVDNLEGFTWHAGETRTSAQLERQAQVLAGARQIWFTFRTGVGYLHFFVALDGAGRVRGVSETAGHQG